MNGLDEHNAWRDEYRRSGAERADLLASMVGSVLHFMSVAEQHGRTFESVADLMAAGFAPHVEPDLYHAFEDARQAHLRYQDCVHA